MFTVADLVSLTSAHLILSDLPVLYLFSRANVLFTVFKTDSVQKINIWAAKRENLSSGRQKKAYSATESSYSIKKIVLLVVLPVFCVSSSRCCGFVMSLPKLLSCCLC